MKKHIILIALFAIASFTAKAQQMPPMEKIDLPEPIVMNLYPDSALKVDPKADPEKDGAVTLNVTVPTISVYLPEKSKATGSAMVVCPGGAFIILAMQSEGYKVAKNLLDQGIAAIVLKYRVMNTSQIDIQEYFKEISLAVPEKPETTAKKHAAQTMAGEDGCQAIKLIRQHAAEWGIKTDHVGIMGFSAGGSTAAEVATIHDSESRPDFVGCIYPFWDKQNVKVPADAAPMFIAAVQIDKTVFDTNWTTLFKAWTAAKVKCDAHIYSDAEHGFGVGVEGKPVGNWMNEMYAYMKNVGFIN